MTRAGSSFSKPKYFAVIYVSRWPCKQGLDGSTKGFSAGACHHPNYCFLDWDPEHPYCVPWKLEGSSNHLRIQAATSPWSSQETGNYLECLGLGWFLLQFF